MSMKWFPTINPQQLENALDDILEVITKLDLLLTLPFLLDVPETSTLAWLFKELYFMETRVLKVDKFVQVMYKIFKINGHLKDQTSVKEFLERVKPLIGEIWNNSLFTLSL